MRIRGLRIAPLPTPHLTQRLPASPRVDSHRALRFELQVRSDWANSAALLRHKKLAAISGAVEVRL